jgi:hypothetical protein
VGAINPSFLDPTLPPGSSLGCHTPQRCCWFHQGLSHFVTQSGPLTPLNPWSNCFLISGLVCEYSIGSIPILLSALSSVLTTSINHEQQLCFLPQTFSECLSPSSYRSPSSSLQQLHRKKCWTASWL